MRSQVIPLATILAMLLGPRVAAAQAHFPVNDDGAHEIGIQGSVDNTGMTCTPPLGGVGGSFGNAYVGDDSGNHVEYAVFSFDTNGWTLGRGYVLSLTEATRVGTPFTSLGGPVQIEYISSTYAYPDRFGPAPGEVDGDYTFIRTVSEAALFDPNGIDISRTVNLILTASHPRYLYIRIRFPNCSNADAADDNFKLVTGGPSVAGSVRIIETTSLFLNEYFAENDNGMNEVGIQGTSSHPVDQPCSFPLGITGGRSTDAPIGDDAGNFNRYAVFSFDMTSWASFNSFVLNAAPYETVGNPSALGNVIVEVLNSANQIPNRLSNATEVQGDVYQQVADIPISQFYSAGGVDISSGVLPILQGPHQKYLYVRLRLDTCTNGDGVADETLPLTGYVPQLQPRAIHVSAIGFPVNPGAATPGQPVDVTATVDGFSLKGGTLYFRPAGSTGAYSSAPMSLAGATLSGTVPGAMVPARGLQYYVVANAGPVIVTFPDPQKPRFLSATFASQAMPVPPAQTYVMMGLPFQPTNGAPAAVLEDDLGPYDNTKWRFGRYDPANDSYLEYPNTPDFLAGNGYWLIQRSPVAVTAGGTSLDPAGVDVKLQPGWNQIATPYLFPVSAADVDFSAAPNVVSRFVGYSSGGYVDQNVLQPWQGYWVLNNGSTAEDIVFQGIESPTPLARPAHPVVSSGTIEVNAEQGSGWDRGNRVGWLGSASSGGPALLDEPPALPGHVSLYFTRTEGEKTRRLTSDLRTFDGAGAVWNLVLDAPGTDPVQLSFSGLGNLPEGQHALLLSDETLAEIDPVATPTLSLAGGRTTRFRLAIGTESYLDALRAGDVSGPPGFALGPGRPNPFRNDLTVAFRLPRESQVAMTVHDTQGRVVKTLVHGTMSAGRHQLVWDGRDDAGHEVAPGLFFLRLESEGLAVTRKVLRLR